LLINGFIPDAQTLRAWQAKIAHVPQDLFIQNSSLAENVAFGRPKNEIDVTRVSEVLEEVGLTDFVMNLPHGVWSHLGEDGGATSGGQRQRICLARALYDPDVQILVLDEPTSALNTELEDEIIRLIFSVKKIKVVIIVTHNRDILKYCNKTMDLDNKNRMFHV
jgi:ATP-binding cassette subfamily B protein